MRRLSILLICASALPALAAEGTDMATEARAYAESTVKVWADDPAIIAAVLAQNARHTALTQTDIDALDLKWRAELGGVVQPTVDAVVKSPTSDVLRAQVDLAGGIITEAFVMDNRGLNVASSGTTSDYWQGDEAKFSETFPVGAGAIHVSEVEFDESTQLYQVQVSFPIVNPADGAVIGAITVALDAEQL
jgi:hypothetical protein